MSTPATTRHSTEQVRAISPVLVTMVALCAWGAWNLIQDNATLVSGVGAYGYLAILVWAVYGAVIVAIVMALQRFARRPTAGIALALAWGGLASTYVAMEANAALSAILLRTINSDPHAWLTTPLVEESIKAVGVVGLAIIPIVGRFRALDGLFYGVLVGAGFQVVEDAIYTITSLFNDPLNPVADIFGTLVLRGFTIGLFTHAVFTGIVGAAIGWVAGSPAADRVKRSLGALGVLILVMVVHGVFNTQDSITPINVAAAIVPLLALLWILRLARRDEVAHLAEAATAAEGWGALGPGAVASIGAPRADSADDRKRGRRVLAFAWAADHLGTDSRQAQRAAQQLVGSAGQ
jgi:RsiW-degrading membrane proteinase PrsW (M82 family)